MPAPMPPRDRTQGPSSASSVEHDYHIIELVAQKEECKASKMHTQSEQAAQRRAEQELHREIDHVRRLRAELEDMEVMEYSYVCHLPRLIRARVSFARAHAQV